MAVVSGGEPEQKQQRVEGATPKAAAPLPSPPADSPSEDFRSALPSPEPDRQTPAARPTTAVSLRMAALTEIEQRLVSAFLNDFPELPSIEGVTSDGFNAIHLAVEDHWLGGWWRRRLVMVVRRVGGAVVPHIARSSAWAGRTP